MDLTNIAAGISEVQNAVNMTEPITDNEETRVEHDSAVCVL